MLKICHLTSAHDSRDVRIFEKECVSLASAGYEVYLVAPGEGREEKGVQVVGLGEKPKSRLKRMLAMARRAYRAALALHCDVYHLHDPELLPYALKLKKQGKKVAFDSHEDVPGQILGKAYIPRFLRAPLSRCVGAYEGYVLKQMDAAVTVTPYIVEKLMRHTPRVYLVTNYPQPADLPAGTGERDERCLCFAGSVTPQWNHETILSAMEGLPLRYALCGTGGEAYLAKLRAMPAWAQVEYRGKLPHEAAQQMLAASGIGVVLCAYSANTGGKMGTLGNTKLFEAMGAGLPVVCTDFTLWQEIVAKYDCGACVQPNDVQAVRAAFERLLEDPAQAKRMGENGRRAVETEYNWATQEKTLLALYKALETA